MSKVSIAVKKDIELETGEYSLYCSVRNSVEDILLCSMSFSVPDIGHTFVTMVDDDQITNVTPLNVSDGITFIRLFNRLPADRKNEILSKLRKTLDSE